MIVDLSYNLLFVKANGMMNGGLPNMPGGYYPLSAPNGMMVCMSFSGLLVLVRRIIWL